MSGTVPALNGDVILVRAAGQEIRYAGFGGTFAILADSCCRKRSLPGLYEPGLLQSAAVIGNGLSLVIKTGHSPAAIMDIAVRNAGAFPYTGDDPAEYIIEINCPGEF